MKKIVVLFALPVWLSSCISIPKQAPQLSTELGGQISKLESSHMTLLSAYFDQKRREVDDFVEEVWLPEFANTFFANEQIQEQWNGIVETNDLDARLAFLSEIGPALQEVINEKRNELIQPLNKLEDELEKAIRKEYDLAKSMNNSLTSFLTSAAKVKENQQRYLDMINITDEKIADAIDKTDSIVNEFLGYAVAVEEAPDKIKELSKKFEAFKKQVTELTENIK